MLNIIGIFFWYTGCCQLFKVFLKITKERDRRELHRNQPTTNLGILLEIYGLGVCPVFHAKDWRFLRIISFSGAKLPPGI